MSDSTNIGPAEFLDLIHGPEALIYFQVAGQTWKNKPQTFRQAEPKFRWRNAEGDGICFIVNAGGTKDVDITGFNACFLDWDCGRGPDGRYMEETSVTVAKAGYRQMLEAFPLMPSILVETRNGFHVYWLLEANVSVDHYRDTQRRLAHHLNGDPACVNPARAIVQQVEAILMEQIARDGYTTATSILNVILGKPNSLIHRRIERVLPGILARNRLQKRTTNNEMKLRFSIGGTGYPKLIVPAVADIPSPTDVGIRAYQYLLENAGTRVSDQ
jgi:hypothetical protein